MLVVMCTHMHMYTNVLALIPPECLLPSEKKISAFVKTVKLTQGNR